MSTREARANFSELIGQVYYTKEPVIVERKGRPFAVVISPEQFERLQREEQEGWALIDRMAERKADRDPDEVLRGVTAAVEEVRQDARKRKASTPTIEEIREKALPILTRYGAGRAGLFGSVVRGDMTTDSDIDILVQLGDDLSLLDVVGIAQELEDALGRKVDLVEYEAIKPLIKAQILAEEVRIL